MRISSAIAATGAMLLSSTSANAATIIQTINPSSYIPANGFSSLFGTLTGVTADVSITTYRQWFIQTPAGSAPNTMNWSIDSYFLVRSLQSISGFPLTVASHGSGTVTQNSGLLNISALGTGSFDLDPAAFIDRGPFTIYESDPGLSNTALNGTTITTSVPATLIQTAGTCFGGMQGSDACGFGSVRLTYNYTPLAAAVPEPATWAMMLVGFGAIGASLRRKRAATPADRRTRLISR